MFLSKDVLGKKGTPVRTRFAMCRFALRQSLACLIVLGLLLMQGGQALAQGFDVSVLFTPDTMTAMQGDTVNYTALFTNNTPNTDLFISNATFNSTDPNFFTTYGNFGFFNGNGMGGGGFELLANQSLTVNNVVSLLLSPTVPVGSYVIDSTFTGRNFADVGDPNVLDRDLGTGTLNLNVTAGAPTPEFGSLWSLGGLLLAGGAGWWRQQRRHKEPGK